MSQQRFPVYFEQLLNNEVRLLWRPFWDGGIHVSRLAYSSEVIAHAEAWDGDRFRRGQVLQLMDGQFRVESSSPLSLVFVEEVTRG